MTRKRVPLTKRQIEQFDTLKIVICNYTGIKKDEFDSKARKNNLVYARKLFIYISKMFIKNKFKSERISTYLDCCHSVVWHHYNNAIELIDESETFGNDVKECLSKYRQGDVLDKSDDSELIAVYRKRILELEHLNEIKQNSIDAHKLAIKNLRIKHQEELRKKPLPLF